MLRSISTEGFIFWWFNCMAAMFVLCWIVKNIGDFLDNHDKLRKNLSFWWLSTLGVIYLYCMFSYVRTLG